LPLWTRDNASECGAKGPGFDSRFLQWFLYLLFCFVVVVFFTFLSKTHYLSWSFAISFAMSFHLYSRHAANLWPIIRGSRYRPSIFNCLYFSIQCSAHYSTEGNNKTIYCEYLYIVQNNDHVVRVIFSQVYRVQPLPQSLLPLVWDFGQLDTTVEELYIRQMVRRCVSIGLQLVASEQ